MSAHYTIDELKKLYHRLLTSIKFLYRSRERTWNESRYCDNGQLGRVLFE